MEPDDDKTHTHITLTKDTMVGHYRIVEKIGAGGMGEVYLAQDTELDRKVALKFLPPHLCRDDDCRKRFKREAQAAAKLSHPNIIHVYEVSEYQGRPFFAMEHVEGRSLRDVKVEELGIDRIVGIAIQLCDGLHTAHASGVIHRDIKPSNIIIDLSGRPKLLDFGLATVKGGEHLTKTGSTLGTVGYMSPEQIEGKATDARSDLFSLGVVLYELIANKSPFRRDDETATLKAILQDTPQPLARYNSNVPDDLQRIITKLLEKDPALRYQSASGVIPDFKKLSAASTASVAIERKRDRWNQYVVPSAVVLLLAVLAIWYFGYRGKEPSTSTAGDKIRLAVLPFKNLGSPEDEYFADGVTEEILSRLAAINGLGVVSSTSSFTYKNTDKPLRQIAQELAVDYVLEGNIRWDKSGEVSVVRVTPQLIQADGDIHLWSKSYDEEITNVFSVQSHIAGQIARVLDIQLTASEESQVTNVPTENMEAYDYYLKGIEPTYRLSDYDRLNELLGNAIELDSSFALAYAHLSFNLSKKHWHFGIGKSPDSAQVRVYAEKAIALDSTLAMGYIALGHYYYWIEYDLDMALVMLQRASSLAPNNDQILRSLSYIMRRTGKWQAAYQFQKRARELNPRFKDGAYPEILRYMRKYSECLAYLDQMLPFQQTAVDSAELIIDKPLLLGLLSEDVFECQRHWSPNFEKYFYNWYNYRIYADCAYWTRDYAEAMRLGNVFLGYAQVSYDSALGYLDLARACEKTNSGMKTVYVDSAITLLNSFKQKDLSLQSRWAVTVGLARAYALGGELSKASTLIDSFLAEKPLEKDALSGGNELITCLPVLVATSRFDDALDLIEQLLAVPSELSIMELKSNPDFDPLRNHPRFQALIQKYEKEYGI